MDFLNAVTLTAPTGMWASIVFWLEGAVKDYALALILVTVLIKLVMVPFDFINKYTSKKSSRIQAEMKPELDKINAKYGNDKNMVNQKTMEVYKSHNFNVMGTCLGMVVYLIFTMVVFWTLFSALNTISTYKIGDQFLQVRRDYFASYDIDVDALTDDQTAISELNQLLETKTEEEKIALKVNADRVALDSYDATKTSFLWIENIWLSDTTWASPVMSYKDFTAKSGIDAVSEDEYNLIITPISSVARNNNGYFILVILAAGINLLSMLTNTWISKARAKKKGLDPNMLGSGNNKLMLIIMPIIMGLFTLFYNSAFGLYIVAGALITLITSPLTTIFVDMLEYDAIKRQERKTVAIYDRKRK